MDELIRAAGIMYLAGNSVLLVLRRPESHSGGMWAFPGGKLEDKEIPLEAALRESKEEIGYAPDTTLQQIDFTQANGVEFTTFLCVTKMFAPALNEEHTGYMWAPLSSLPSPLHPGVSRTLLQYRNMNSAMDDSARQVDQNGYINIPNNPISRAGIFPYLLSSVLTEEEKAKYRREGRGDELHKTVPVYRPADELSDTTAMESFKLIPLIDDHVMLGPKSAGYTPAEQKGVHGITGEDVEFKDGVLYANLKIFSNYLADMVKRGKKDLSLGYRCIYEKVSGIFNGQPYEYVQRRLRGNHLALVKEARCDVSVLDHNIAFDNFNLAFDWKELTMADTKEKPGEQAKDAKTGVEPSTQPFGGGPLTSDAKGKDAMTEEEKKAKDAKEEMDKKAKDEAEEKKKAEDKKAKDAKDAEEKEKKEKEESDKKAKDAACTKEEMDAAISKVTSAFDSFKKDGMKAFLREINEKTQLANQLSNHIGTFDHSEMTLDEVAKYGVEKLGMTCQDGHERTLLQGFLHSRSVATQSHGFDSKAMDSSSAGVSKGLLTLLNKSAA